jgi:tRNA pseudouridine32 synthase/23S rRNA pseudouridine746 synthase
MREVEGVPNSETRIDVIERTDACWRYALEPVTGRKHQLRVHMAALGAPILNDRVYPKLIPADGVGYGFEGPLKLLARALVFDDPLSGAARRFESTLAL